MKKYPCLLIDQRIFWRQTQLLQTSCSLDSWRQRTSKQNTKIGAWKKKQIHAQRPKSAMFSCQHLKKKKKRRKWASLDLLWLYRAHLRVEVHDGKGHMTYGGAADTHSLSEGHRRHRSIGQPCHCQCKARRNVPRNRQHVTER